MDDAQTRDFGDLPGVRLLTVTAEFGTVDAGVPAQLVELCYPKDDRCWLEGVLGKGGLFIDGIFAGLGSVR